MKKILSFAIITSLFLSGFSDSSSLGKIKIGEQVWMTENLDVTKFRNGDKIMEARTDEEWLLAGAQRKPAWCYYENDPVNGQKSGKLYNFYAITDVRGLAPKGWHIPNEYEWKEVTEYLGGSDKAGLKLKSKTGWDEKGKGDNSSGMNAMPGGARSDVNEFYNLEDASYWWGIEQVISTDDPVGYWHVLNSLGDGFSKKRLSKNQNHGLSVRCIKN